MMEQRAKVFERQLEDDCHLFSDAIDGSEPWKPDAITQYFTRLRARIGLEHLDCHYLRKFMETYGQDLGFPPVQVALRAGHDPSVAATPPSTTPREHRASRPCAGVRRCPCLSPIGSSPSG